LLESITLELSPTWTQKQLSLSLELPDEPLWVLADPDRLKQVFVNLIDNAIKYTPDQGSIRVSALKAGDRVQCVVKDSGIGIPAGDLPRIFDRFYRIDKARASSVAGTGLGLAIVKNILDALGGTIEVESQPYSGTTFRFFLPVVAPDLPTNT
jgi:two-component system phosphate regulon sensor histidine kinase PhoR